MSIGSNLSPYVLDKVSERGLLQNANPSVCCFPLNFPVWIYTRLYLLQIFYAYGFGATLREQGSPISHCFPLNFDWADPGLCGVEEVIAAYQNVLTKVDLYGPTNFGEILDEVLKQAEAGINTTPLCYQVYTTVKFGSAQALKIYIVALDPGYSHGRRLM